MVSRILWERPIIRICRHRSPKTCIFSGVPDKDVACRPCVLGRYFGVRIGHRGKHGYIFLRKDRCYLPKSSPVSWSSSYFGSRADDRSTPLFLCISIASRNNACVGSQ